MLLLKRGILAGLAGLIFSFVLNWLTGILVPQINLEYQTSGLFRSWEDPLMMAFFLYPFVLGLAMAYFWEKIAPQLRGKTAIAQAYEFARLNFIIATIPGMFVTFSSFQVSALMVLVWTVSGLAQTFIAGYVFARLKR